MPNHKYDHDKIIEMIAEYFFTKYQNGDLSISFKKLYSDIVQYAHSAHKKVKMPAFSQARKILIAELKAENLLENGENITTEIAHRITKLFYDDSNMDELLHHEYDITLYRENPIVCTIKLPSVEILDILAEGYGIERNKSITWGRINMIQRICRKIKQKNPELILAVIPEFNRMMYLNRNGLIDSKIKDCDIICDTLCMFVRNTEEGRKFVKELSKNMTN